RHRRFRLEGNRESRARARHPRHDPVPAWHRSPEAHLSLQWPRLPAHRSCRQRDSRADRLAHLARREPPERTRLSASRRSVQLLKEQIMSRIGIPLVFLLLSAPIVRAQFAQPDGGDLEHGVLPAKWQTGGPRCMEIPEWQVHEYNPDLYILRQSGC